MPMDRTARAVAADLLDRAADQFANHGCNDYSLQATPENIAFVRAAQAWADPDSEGPHVYEGEVVAMDWLLMEYLAHLLLMED